MVFKTLALNSRAFTLIFFLFSFLFSSAQEKSEYVRKFPNKVTVRTGLQNTGNSFIFTDKETGEQTEYQPNDKTYLGMSFLFRSVELDVGYAPKFFPENKDNAGSKLLALNFRMFLGRWMQTLDFYKQKGFFAYGDDQSIEAVPELGTLKLGGSTSFVFNKKFSFRAIGFQNEWQKKSAGSFIPSLTFYYTRFKVYDSDFRSRQYSYDLAVGPGYYYNWVIGKNFIVSAGALVGLGLNITSFEEEENYMSLLLQTKLRTAIGYNSERFFTGINANLNFLQHDHGDESFLQDDIKFFEFYLGYRFKAPKKWIERGDRFNSALGLN